MPDRSFGVTSPVVITAVGAPGGPGQGSLGGLPAVAITVTITDIDTPTNTATAISTANVADAPLTASCTNQVSSQTYAGVVASFTDANPFATIADFTTTISWGDATPATAGTVTPNGSGGFDVNGTHTYASTGPFTVTTTINDDGGSTRRHRARSSSGP
jgi:hypothetical protein